MFVSRISIVGTGLWNPAVWWWQKRLCASIGARPCQVVGVWRVPRPFVNPMRRLLLVPPTAYVELRALDIAKQEIEELGPAPFKPGSEVLRLWPFRWPAHEPEPSLPQGIDERLRDPGGYIDILL